MTQSFFIFPGRQVACVKLWGAFHMRVMPVIGRSLLWMVFSRETVGRIHFPAVSYIVYLCVSGNSKLFCILFLSPSACFVYLSQLWSDCFCFPPALTLSSLVFSLFLSVFVCFHDFLLVSFLVSLIWLCWFLSIFVVLKNRSHKYMHNVYKHICIYIFTDVSKCKSPDFLSTSQSHIN